MLVHLTCFYSLFSSNCRSQIVSCIYTISWNPKHFYNRSMDEDAAIYYSVLTLFLNFFVLILYNTLISGQFEAGLPSRLAYNAINFVIMSLFILQPYVMPRLSVYEVIAMAFAIFKINFFLYCVFSPYQNDNLLESLFLKIILF